MAEQTQRPVGAVSTDGQFEWDGLQWVPRGSRGASRWTRPMQLAATVYLVALAASTLTVNLFLGGSAIARLRLQYEQAGIAPAQAANLAQSMSGVLVVASVVFSIIYVLLALASLRGWSWVFWVDAVVLLIGSFNVFSNLGALQNGSTVAVVTEVVAVAALALLCWFVVSLFRFGFGAWARPRRARAGAAV